MFLYLFDKKAQSKVSDPILLSQWIENRLSSKEWNDLGISETKYRASFFPLFHKNILNREENAAGLGTTYGTLKIFLTQQPVKKAVKDNMSAYAEYYCKRLIARLGKKFLYIEKKKDTTEVDKGYKMFTDEAEKYYSRRLVEAITKRLLQITTESKGQVREAANISYPIILKILEERFKDKGDKVTYQKMRLLKLQDILLTIERGLKDNEFRIGEGKSIAPKSKSMHLKSIENARKLINEIYKDTK